MTKFVYRGQLMKCVAGPDEVIVLLCQGAISDKRAKRIQSRFRQSVARDEPIVVDNDMRLAKINLTKSQLTVTRQ